MPHELTTLEQGVADLYLARKQNKLNQYQIGEQFDVSRSTVQRVLKRPHVKQYMKEQVLEVARDSLADVMRALTKKAMECNRAKFVELYLKTLGMLESDTKVEVSQINEVHQEDRSNEAIQEEINQLKRQLEAH